MAGRSTIVGGHPDGWNFAAAASGIVNSAAAVTIKAAGTAPVCNSRKTSAQPPTVLSASDPTALPRSSWSTNRKRR